MNGRPWEIRLDRDRVVKATSNAGFYVPIPNSDAVFCVWCCKSFPASKQNLHKQDVQHMKNSVQKRSRALENTVVTEWQNAVKSVEGKAPDLICPEEEDIVALLFKEACGARVREVELLNKEAGSNRFLMGVEVGCAVRLGPDKYRFQCFLCKEMPSGVKEYIIHLESDDHRMEYLQTYLETSMMALQMADIGPSKALTRIACVLQFQQGRFKLWEVSEADYNAHWQQLRDLCLKPRGGRGHYIDSERIAAEVTQHKCTFGCTPEDPKPGVGSSGMNGFANGNAFGLLPQVRRKPEDQFHPEKTTGPRLLPPPKASVEARSLFEPPTPSGTPVPRKLPPPPPLPPGLRSSQPQVPGSRDPRLAGANGSTRSPSPPRDPRRRPSLPDVTKRTDTPVPTDPRLRAVTPSGTPQDPRLAQRGTVEKREVRALSVSEPTAVDFDQPSSLADEPMPTAPAEEQNVTGPSGVRKRLPEADELFGLAKKPKVAKKDHRRTSAKAESSSSLAMSPRSEEVESRKDEKLIKKKYRENKENRMAGAAAVLAASNPLIDFLRLWNPPDIAKRFQKALQDLITVAKTLGWVMPFNLEVPEALLAEFRVEKTLDQLVALGLKVKVAEQLEDLCVSMGHGLDERDKAEAIRSSVSVFREAKTELVTFVMNYQEWERVQVKQEPIAGPDHVNELNGQITESNMMPNEVLNNVVVKDEPMEEGDRGGIPDSDAVRKEKHAAEHLKRLSSLVDEILKKSDGLKSTKIDFDPLWLLKNELMMEKLLPEIWSFLTKKKIQDLSNWFKNLRDFFDETQDDAELGAQCREWGVKGCQILEELDAIVPDEDDLQQSTVKQEPVEQPDVSSGLLTGDGQGSAIIEKRQAAEPRKKDLPKSSVKQEPVEQADVSPGFLRGDVVDTEPYLTQTMKNLLKNAGEVLALANSLASLVDLLPFKQVHEELMIAGNEQDAWKGLNQENKLETLLERFKTIEDCSIPHDPELQARCLTLGQAGGKVMRHLMEIATYEPEDDEGEAAVKEEPTETPVEVRNTVSLLVAGVFEPEHFEARVIERFLLVLNQVLAKADLLRKTFDLTVITDIHEAIAKATPQQALKYLTKDKLRSLGGWFEKLKDSASDPPANDAEAQFRSFGEEGGKVVQQLILAELSQLEEPPVVVKQERAVPFPSTFHYLVAKDGDAEEVRHVEVLGELLKIFSQLLTSCDEVSELFFFDDVGEVYKKLVAVKSLQEASEIFTPETLLSFEKYFDDMRNEEKATEGFAAECRVLAEKGIKIIRELRAIGLVRSAQVKQSVPAVKEEPQI